MADKSVIIIGAGIGGLSAGCYARMNGYRAAIFEMHNKPGGLCTAWERKGYNIDACLHWLTGSAPSSNYYRLWEEIGAVKGKDIIDMEQFYRVESVDGKVFTMYTNLDRLEVHMREISPEDTIAIKELIGVMRRLSGMNLPIDKPPELYSPFDGITMTIRMLPYIRDMLKWGRMTMTDLAGRFQNALLRDSMLAFWGSELSTIGMLMFVAMMHNKTAGYVIGGSLEMSRSVERRYLDLGGEIHYKSKVSKVIVENDRAVGVRLADGSEHRADYVISAADGHATIFDMLDGKYCNDTVRGYYAKLPIFQPLIFISLGVNRVFEEMPKMISGLLMELEKPVRIAGKEQKWLSVRIHNFDPTLTPQGKTLLTMFIESNYSYWETLHQEITRYKEEKLQIADLVISLLDKRFPGLAGQVEMKDVATPVTFHRYTGNWQGSYEGWLMIPQTLNLNMSKTLPGLDNFYMAGQWVQPGGGLPSGVMTARNVVQFLCKRDRMKFTTTIA